MEADALTSQAEHTASALPPATGSSRINIGTTERIVSVIGGAALSVLGARNLTSRSGRLMLFAGGYLLARGASGYCALNNLFGRNTAVKKAPAMEVTGTFVIRKPRTEVYAFWRNLENLPRFMTHLKEVHVLDERRSSWTAKLPGGIGTVSWDAMVENEEENSHLSWCSLPGSTIDNAGTVTFKDAEGGRATEIDVAISYRLPAGQVGSIAARLFNPAVKQLLRADIERFKSLMESGEAPQDGEARERGRRVEISTNE